MFIDKKKTTQAKSPNGDWGNTGAEYGMFCANISRLISFCGHVFNKDNFFYWKEPRWWKHIEERRLFQTSAGAQPNLKVAAAVQWHASLESRDPKHSTCWTQLPPCVLSASRESGFCSVTQQRPVFQHLHPRNCSLPQDHLQIILENRWCSGICFSHMIVTSDPLSWSRVLVCVGMSALSSVSTGCCHVKPNGIMTMLARNFFGWGI